MTEHRRQNRGKLAEGYTIVEVLIVLAVSSLLFLSAVLAVNGRQAQTQFSQSVRLFDSRLQDVINDVSTGYYPDIRGFNCGVTAGSSVRFTVGSNSAGTNSECIFIGRVMHFAEQGSGGERMNTFTVVGKRLYQTAAGAREVDSLLATGPKAVDPSASDNSAAADLTENESLEFGLRITSVKNSSGQDISAIGFFGSFAQFGGASGGNVVSGSQTVAMHGKVGPLDESRGDIVQWIETDLGPNENDAKDAVRDGVIICTEGAGGRKASITIGQQGRQLSTTVDQNGAGC